MFNYREERMKQCLRCPVCHEVLQNYGNILAIGNGKRQDDGIVNELAALLKIEGTARQKFDVLFSLSKQYKNPEKYFRENTDCLCSLNHIISSVQQFASDLDDYESLLYETFPFGFRVLKEMLEKLSACDSAKDSSSRYADIPLCFRPLKSDYQDAKDFFNQFKCKNLRPYMDGEKPLEGYTEDDEQPEIDWQTIADLMQKIFDDFCFASPEEGQLPPYEYCAPQYDYPELKNCQSAMFLAMANQLKKQIGSIDLDQIPSTYQNIVLEYVEQAPKHFGNNLKKVMEIQGMEIKDVSSLMKKDSPSHPNSRSSPNEISALCACKEPKHDKEYLHRLARCLLVSDEVLISGTGESYGTWKSVLSTDGLETIMKYTRQSSKKKAEMWTRAEIKSWLALSDSDFEKLMADNPDFFVKEPICVYEIEEDGETIPDYTSMVKNLLHPEEFEVLKQVLQNQQDQ